VAEVQKRVEIYHPPDGNRHRQSRIREGGASIRGKKRKEKKICESFASV